MTIPSPPLPLSLPLPAPSPRSPCPPSLATMCLQCGVPGLISECACSVWRAGPQPRFSGLGVVRRPQPRVCAFCVACRAPTASGRGQCGVPPQQRSREFSVACPASTASVGRWTSIAILWSFGVPTSTAIV